MTKCAHDEYEVIPDTGFEFAGCGETVELKVKCNLCGKIGREVYTYSTTIF